MSTTRLKINFDWKKYFSRFLRTLTTFTLPIIFHWSSMQIWTFCCRRACLLSWTIIVIPVSCRLHLEQVLELRPFHSACKSENNHICSNRNWSVSDFFQTNIGMSTIDDEDQQKCAYRVWRLTKMKTKKLNIAHYSGIASNASLVSVSCVMALIPTRLKYFTIFKHTSH